jgi:omega-amidase
VKIACAQIDCEIGDVAANVAKLRDFAFRARDAGCELVVFPEMADTTCDMEAARQHGASWDGGAFAAVQAIAREASLCIVCGLSERDGERLFNSVAIVAPDGALLARYRKTHLITTEPFSEEKVFTAGDALRTFEFGGFTFGVMVCYDLRFPEVARHYATHGAEAIVMPSAWPASRIAHWRTLVAARAIENQLYLACANRTGIDGEVVFGGTSLIVDPWGEAIAAASERDEELVVAAIELQRVRDVREYMPVFKHRRTDLC